MTRQSLPMRGGRTRTTKHLSALDFLLNIQMRNEEEIVKRGMSQLANDEAPTRFDDDMDNQSMSTEGNNSRLPLLNDELVPSTLANVGKRLPGPPCETHRIPSDLRYRISRMLEQNQSTRLQKWEDQFLKSGTSLLQSRIIFSRARAYPSMLCSIITYNAAEEKERQERQSGADIKSLEIFDIPPRDWRGISYRGLMENPSYSLGCNYIHDPNKLDDPKMVHGSSRTESMGDAKRGPIIYSFIKFKNKRELKDQLNEQFRDRHPQLPPSLTFSKIRNLKKSLLLGCISLGIEVSTAALAYVCFERLCLKGIVNKINRHLTMSVCFVLAYKFLTESLTTPHYRQGLDALMSFIDREWEVSTKEVMDAEFGALVQLGFLLHVPHQHLLHVYNKLLKLLHKSSRMYLGEEMHQQYIADESALEKGGVIAEEEEEYEDPETQANITEVVTDDPHEAVQDMDETVQPENRRPFMMSPFIRKTSFAALGGLLGGPEPEQMLEPEQVVDPSAASSIPILALFGLGRRTPPSTTGNDGFQKDPSNLFGNDASTDVNIDQQIST